MGTSGSPAAGGRSAYAHLTPLFNRRVILIVFVIVALVLAAFAYAGWQFASQIASDALLLTHDDPQLFEVPVLASGDGTVTLGLTEEDAADLRSSELLGIDWPDGYGQLGAVLEEAEGAVTRAFFPLAGDPPPPGTMVDLDAFAFPDPASAGIGPEDVRYSSPFGEFDAWVVPGVSPTWVVMTHGRGVHRGEALRILPTIVAAGHPALVITYRNDEGQPATADRFVRFGATEWEDLEGAVRYALDRGAHDVVLYGYSMGGAISMSFVYRSELATKVKAMILDAPALDFGAIIDREAAESNLPVVPIRVPAVLTAFSKWLTQLRFGIDWAELDYVARATELSVPILLFHGDTDDKVPVGSSDRLAELRPDLVTYERYPDTGHVRAWNVDRERYETAVREFLAGL